MMASIYRCRRCGLVVEAGKAEEHAIECSRGPSPLEEEGGSFMPIIVAGLLLLAIVCVAIAIAIWLRPGV
jgi:hypothetical protein